MSEDAALKFFDAIDKSPRLQDQIRSQGLERDRTSESRTKFIDMAAKEGYHFSAEDLAAAIKARARQRMQTEEISDDDLDQVAGGMRCNFTGTCGDTCLTCLLTL
jgi:predicted ribosomally synthesized peptide with nif11-like leader